MGAPRIAVIGVGGAGGSAINNMIQADLEGVEFWVANTDAQALEQSSCESQIQLGANLTKGLGAGSRPEIGQAAAEEAKTAITSALAGTNMTFITAGMGGGTGTGGAPIIAQIAREEGVLTVGVVSKPFDFEGTRRMRQAEEGIAELSIRRVGGAGHNTSIRSSLFPTKIYSALPMTKQPSPTPLNWPTKCSIPVCAGSPI